VSQNTISSKDAYKNNTHRSKNDPLYESDLFMAMEHLFIYVYTKRAMKLKHRSNRSTHRKTNLNLDIKDTTIIELMRDFLLKKDLAETYSVPQDLKFFRKFHKSYTGSITFSTLYTSFHNLKTKKFIQKFPSVTFNNLSLSLQKRLGIVVTENILNDDYDTIKDFLRTF